jgi:hypothetical protein
MAMTIRHALRAGVALGVALFLSPRSMGQSKPPVDFSRDISPILSNHCFACHGPDAAQRKADLRLDVEKEAKKLAISPGDLSDSELWARITNDDVKKRMPLEEAHNPLSPPQIELIGRWIEEGAVWARHWAWVAPKRATPPAASKPVWVKNEIDRFVLAGLDTAGLAPSPEADRTTLIRRLSLDLIGLPPTPAEVDAFVADTARDAYEKVVDRLLASPHYGERMAMDWLDGARYADTNGFQNDFERNMWPWRDWVINAYNANMPFNQFAVEQLAGDLLPNATDAQRIATGFNRNNRSNTEGGSIEDEWRAENIIDRVETTSTVFLGLTMGCARCHDHKYDPITQKDFYKFFAFLNSTEDKGFYEETHGNTGPIVELASDEQKARLAEIDVAIAAAKVEVDAEKALDADVYPRAIERLGSAAVTDFAIKPAITAATPRQIKAKRSAAAQWVDGLVGPALFLDGSDGVRATSRKRFDFQKDKPFSVSVWVRPEKAGAIFSSVAEKADVRRGVDTLVTGDGKLIVRLAGKSPDDMIKVTTDTRLKMQTWAHVAVTYDGSGKGEGVKVYFSGRPASLKIDTNKLTVDFRTKAPLLLGRLPTSEYFKGTIADLRVYDQALAEEGINALIETTLRATRAIDPSDARKASLTAFLELQHSFSVRAKEAVASAKQKERDDYLKANVPTVMVMRELPEPRPTYRLVRGQYDNPDKNETLTPDVPEFLPPLPAGSPRNRLTLAQWIVDPANPLTARVAVNRLWIKFFGQGLVKTPENFGAQSEPPSNPGLLDWLATEFVCLNWDVKAIQKKMLMSAAYRQISDVSPALFERDPENRLLARGPRFRLPAEVVRDNALAVSGLLAMKIGGPSVMPYQPEGLWDELAGGAGQGPYKLGSGEDLYRRSLYTYRKRTVPHPLIGTFDAPSFETCRVMRARTNTPLQALALLNDVTYVEAARNLAQRMVREATPPEVSPLRYGVRLALGRNPTADEEQLLQSGLEKFMSTYRSDPEAAKALVTNGQSPVPDDLDKPTLAAYTALASVILNMDETITKE